MSAIKCSAHAQIETGCRMCDRELGAKQWFCTCCKQNLKLCSNCWVTTMPPQRVCIFCHTFCGAGHHTQKNARAMLSVFYEDRHVKLQCIGCSCDIEDPTNMIVFHTDPKTADPQATCRVFNKLTFRGEFVRAGIEGTRRMVFPDAVGVSCASCYVDTIEGADKHPCLQQDRITRKWSTTRMVSVFNEFWHEDDDDYSDGDEESVNRIEMQLLAPSFWTKSASRPTGLVEDTPMSECATPPKSGKERQFVKKSLCDAFDAVAH